MIDFFTNVFRTYYVTATPGRSSWRENRIFQLSIKNVPTIDLFNEDKDPLLKKRLAELEKKNPEEAKNIRKKNSALEEILIKLAKQYE
jgi:hypothetical protein